MTAEDQTTPTARAAETLRRGAGAATMPERGPRAFLRRVLLRVLRPYTHHQQELDTQLMAALRSHQAELERHTEQIERLEELARELILTAESLRRASSDAAGDAAVARRTVEPIAAELYASPYMADSPFELRSTPVGEALGFTAGAGAGRDVDVAVCTGQGAGGGEGAERGDGDSDYVAFEQLFRGPAERVVELQRPYLTLLADHEPVLDVGCGRGEFLELLASEGVAARGVDSDAGMVARCRALGLDVEQGDANEHLSGLPDGSLGAIFSAQVIEHLPHEQLSRLLELSLRKLSPGGLFIAETVNPHRISSLKTFWVDLTHQ